MQCVNLIHLFSSQKEQRANATLKSTTCMKYELRHEPWLHDEKTQKTNLKLQAFHSLL